MRIIGKICAELCQVYEVEKNPHAVHRKNVYKHVDNVDNYFEAA